MFAESFISNNTSSASAANPASVLSDPIAAETALFHTLFTMPAPINTISQDFCLFDADEASFDYPLFNGANGNALATAKAMKSGQEVINNTNVNFFNNPLCTPQTPSLDLANGTGFDSCTALFDDSTMVSTHQALIDTPFTPCLDTPLLMDTPLETSYLSDFGVEDVKPLFSDFSFDFTSFNNVFTIEPNMLLPADQQIVAADNLTLPSPSLSPSLSILSSAPTSPLSDSLIDLEESESDDDEFESTRSAALVSGMKRKSQGAPVDAVKKVCVATSVTAKKPTVKRFPCNHPGCDRRFARLYNLTTHEKTHDPEQARPFICTEPTCAKAFSRKHDLQRHEASVHKGERNFACPSCQKPFSRQDGLRRHLAVKGTCSDNAWLAT
ncbi:hypothetical protein BGZ51_004672 [Haplosporangium sp. Z 767]|nr:hypothetical protein BGZ50_008504 [Haplosporangium sp. Z 11]KAF9182553.1 hypothetical protein BGZ51_004672 [Haplosporangium sp. Z 767]